MPQHFYMKQNDTEPALQVDLTDAEDDAVILTGATIKFFMRIEPQSTVKINGSAATVIDADAGRVQYQWASAGDTDDQDDFEAEFEVTYAGGGIQTFPGRNYILVHIVDDIG